MINASDALRTALTADARRVDPRVIADISDPDLLTGAMTYPTPTPYARPEQLLDKETDITAPLITLEPHRWILDGSYIPMGGESEDGQIGYVSDAISDADGHFAEPQTFSFAFSGVDVLRAISLYFSGYAEDGVPSELVIEALSGEDVYYREEITGNTQSTLIFKGFTVYYPTSIRLTITRWSLPHRRLRMAEMIAGIYEIWSGDELAALSVTQQSAFNDLTLPYGTCVLRMDNLDRRFEPRSKDGLFESIEERQAVKVYVGVKTGGAFEYIPVGWFYQFQNGWKTGDNDISMEWSLVDIIGLLLDREFKPDGALPTTLEGWASALVGQLGVNFAKRYTVDPDYAGLACTVKNADAVNGQKCGQILMWICQATETWPRADAETGNLAIEPFWNQGVTLTLDNLTRYPVMRANEDIARVDFTLSDETVVSYAGTSSSAPRTANIVNPFLHTAAAAAKAAKIILSAYGGAQIETVGRGDPTSEIGDVATVELDESSATTGRVSFQTFSFTDGVLQSCQTTMLQADGSYLFQNRELIAESGTWTAPDGVRRIRLILGQGGHGGYTGGAATWEENGSNGSPGPGGKIWVGTIDINDGQSFSVQIGRGGGPSAEGGETTFGVFSSANGEVYPNGYTDIANGDVFARPGVASPRPNSGDGGRGGNGGAKGERHEESRTVNSGYYDSELGGRVVVSEWEERYEVIDREPGLGSAGSSGGSGFVLVYYDLG